MKNKHDGLIMLSDQLHDLSQALSEVVRDRHNNRWAWDTDYALVLSKIRPVIKQIETYLHINSDIQFDDYELFSENKPYSEVPDNLKRAASLLRCEAELKQKSVNEAPTGNYIKKGDMYEFRFEGVTKGFRPLEGIKVITYLIENKGKSFKPFEIITNMNPVDDPRAKEVSDAFDVGDMSMSKSGITAIKSSNKTLDKDTLDYLHKKYIPELEQEYEKCTDPARQSEIQNEIQETKEFILKNSWRDSDGKIHIKNLDGGNPAEKARKSVSENVKNAKKVIRKSHKALHEHLEILEISGNGCCYQPHPDVSWKII